MATGTRLFGRDRELAVLGDAIARARAGRRTAVVIEGEAGIGKSRLLTEALASLRDPEDAVGVGHGVELFDGQVPYATIADTLRTLARGLGDAQLRSAAGAYASALAPLAPAVDADPAARTDVDRMRLLPAYVHTVETLATDRLVWIVVEDLHWSDTSSLDLLGYLVRVTDASRLLVLASIRTNDPATDRARADYVDSLTALDGVVRLHLEALDPQETAALVADLTGRTSDDADVVRLAALGQGNPLQTEQLVDALHSGRPTETNHAMEARVRELDPAALRVVQLAALGDGHLFQHLLEQVYAAWPPGDVPWAVARQAALGSGLLTYDVEAREFTFSHALLRQAAESTLGPVDRIDGHRLWAEALAAPRLHRASSPPDPRLLVAVAGHWARTDSDTEAFASALEAADVANRLGASDTAVDLLLRAWSLWDHVPDPEACTDLARDDVLRELCAATIPADRISEAIAVLDREIEGTPRHVEQMRSLHLRLTRAELSERLGAPMDSLLYQEATGAINDLRRAPPTPLKGPALSALGWYLRWRDPDLSGDVFAEAAEIVWQAGPRAHFPYESAVGVTKPLGQGDFEASLAWIDDALARANSVYDASSLVCTRASVMLNAGLTRRAADAADEAVSMFPDPRLAGAMWGLVALTAFEPHLAVGNWASVYRGGFLEACAGLEVEDFEVTIWLECHQARFACARGDVAAAAAHAAVAREMLPDEAAAHLTHRRPARVAQAESAFRAQGRFGEALGHLDPLLDEPALPQLPGLWTAVLPAARIAADDRTRTDRQMSGIRRAAQRLPQNAPLFAACRLQTDADLARAEQLDDVPTWERVRDAWHDIDHVPHLGWAYLRLAKARVQTGDKADGAECLAEAWQIARRLGAVPLRTLRWTSPVRHTSPSELVNRPRDPAFRRCCRG